MSRKRVSENEVVVTPGAGAAPTRRKTSARSRAKHTPATETEPAETPVAASPTDLTTETSATPETIVVTETYLSAPVLAVFEPAHDEIALEAYLYWEERGCQGGSAEEDWLRAEARLRQRANSKVTA